MPIAQGAAIGALPIGGTSGTGSPAGIVGNAITPLPSAAASASAQISAGGSATTPLPEAVGFASTNRQATGAGAATTPVPGVSGSAVGALPSQSLYFVVSEGDTLVVSFGAAPVVNFVPL